VTNGPYRRPQADLYTVLLLLALIALILGGLCWYGVLAELDFKDKGKPVISFLHAVGACAPFAGYFLCRR
jgi:hypothetical protein